VRLPGTVTPASVLVQKNLPAGELMNLLNKEFALRDTHERQLVLIANEQDPGKVIKSNELIQKHSEDVS
jgi:hypothetical protein